MPSSCLFAFLFADEVGVLLSSVHCNLTVHRLRAVSVRQAPLMHIRLQSFGRCINPASAKAHVAKAQTPASSQSQRNAEAYEQWDMSAVHAYRARQVYIESIRHGEAAADLARAATAAAAEDDAIGTRIKHIKENPTAQRRKLDSRHEYSGSQSLLQFSMTC